MLIFYIAAYALKLRDDYDSCMIITKSDTRNSVALAASDNDGTSEPDPDHKFIPKLEGFLTSEKFRKRQVFPDRGTYEMLVNLLTNKVKTGNGHDYDQKVKQKFEVIKRENGEEVLVWRQTQKRILKQDDFLRAIKKAHDNSGILSPNYLYITLYYSWISKSTLCNVKVIVAGIIR